MAETNGDLRHIPLSQIRQSPIALRDVDKTSEKYKEMAGSIRNNGILNPISVREIAGDGGIQLYGVIDGLHRFEGAKDAGLETIPAYIKNMNDAEVEEAQILANIHRVETKPVEYSRQLQKILTRNPTLTMSELASRLSKSTTWLSERLNLTNLSKQLGDLVDEGKIGLANAYALAKLPPEIQVDYAERAMTLPPSEFVPQVTKHVKEIRDAKRQGRNPNPQFEPQAHLRKVSILKDELQHAQAARALCASLKTPTEGFEMALKWVLNLDPHSVEEQRQRWEKRRQEEAEAKKKRELERQQKKEQEAREQQEKLQTEMANAGA
jgi:ParB/RepB/Spo0J family partition protein